MRCVVLSSLSIETVDTSVTNLDVSAPFSDASQLASYSELGSSAHEQARCTEQVKQYKPCFEKRGSNASPHSTQARDSACGLASCACTVGVVLPDMGHSLHILVTASHELVAEC